MQLFPNDPEIPRSEWGEDYVVITDQKDPDQWIMFDPETDEVDLEDWR